VNQRVLGFMLIAASIVGVIAALAGLDQRSSAGLAQYGIGFVISRGVTFGELPFGFVLAAFVAITLAGVGLLIFGKK
jgi:hypothetical protein